MADFERIDPVTAEAQQFFQPVEFPPKEFSAGFPEGRWGRLSPEQRQLAVKELYRLPPDASYQERVGKISAYLPDEAKAEMLREAALESHRLPELPTSEPPEFIQEERAARLAASRPEAVGEAGIVSILGEEPTASVPEPTAKEERMGKVSALLGVPSPSIVRPPELIDIGREAQARRDALIRQREASLALAEAEGKAIGEQQGILQAQQVALQDRQTAINERRKEIDDATTERINAELYAGARTGGRSYTDWLSDRKAVIANEGNKYTPEQIEEAQQELEDAQAVGGIQGIVGEWWQKLLVGFGLALGAFASAKMGTPNQVANFFFRAVEMKQKEEELKRKRMRTILGMKQKQAEIGLERTEQDFERERMGQIYELEKIKLGMQELRTKYTSEQDLAKIDQVEAEFDARLDQLKNDQALQKYSIDVRKDIADRQLEQSRLALEFKARTEEMAGSPQGYATLLYKQGALPHKESTQKIVREGVSEFRNIERAMSDLIAKAEGMSLAGYTTLSPEGKELMGRFGKLIDLIRNNKNWGAKFEQTEAQTLIPAYLGKGKATNFGWWLKVLRQTREDFRFAFDTFIDVYDMERPGAREESQLQQLQLPKTAPAR
jgi:hypothetical protein